MSEYFPKPKSIGANETVELDLSHLDLTGVDISDFAKKY